jgi:hypothetical protein
MTLPLRGGGLQAGEGDVAMQSVLAQHPPLASLDPPSGKVTKPDDHCMWGDESDLPHSLSKIVEHFHPAISDMLF